MIPCNDSKADRKPGTAAYYLEKKPESVLPALFRNETAKVNAQWWLHINQSDRWRFRIGDSDVLQPRWTRKVYFTAKNLDEYDVFPQSLDGTDPYTHANKGKNRTFQSNAGEGSEDERQYFDSGSPDIG